MRTVKIGNKLVGPGQPCYVIAEIGINHNGDVDLAKRLKKHGFKDETEASITNKLKRGTFPATFFLACLAALELDGVALEEI